MAKTYYKAVRKDGVTATRGSLRDDFDRALVRHGGSDSHGSTFIGRGKRVPNYEGELCDAVKITAAEFRQLKAAAR